MTTGPARSLGRGLQVTIDAGNGSVLAQQAQDSPTRPTRRINRSGRATGRTDRVIPPGGGPSASRGDRTADSQVPGVRLPAAAVTLPNVLASVTARVRPISPAVLWFAASVLAWVALLGMVVTREGLAEDDRPLYGWLIGHRGPGWTAAMEAVSSSVTTAVLPVVAFGVVLAMGLMARSWRPFVTVLLATGGAAVSGFVLKAIVQRARPPVATMLGIPETGYGFPSNHTLVTSALVGALALVVWRATPRPGARAGAIAAAVLAALLMGASRLYVGDHWFTDILAAYAVAGAVLAAVAWATGPVPWTRAEQSVRQALRRRSDRR